MRKNLTSAAGFFHPRVLLAFVLCSVGVLLALLGFGVYPGASAFAQPPSPQAPPRGGLKVVASFHNDVSPPLRDLALLPVQSKPKRDGPERRKLPNNHQDSPDVVIQKSLLGYLAPSIAEPILNFAGIPFPGVGCNCAPPDPNGAVGATQYVQIVNEGYQVFNKSNGASVLGPASISSVWAGFGGVCENNGSGDPIVLYDHFANRWVISQFAGNNRPTDECIAVSTTSDATGTYNRYGFHLGSEYFDYPKLAVWPDAYYMSMNVFNAGGTVFLGPQPFAFDRAAMLAGSPATFISPVGPLGGSTDTFLPADIDGPTLPPAGAPETFVSFPGSGAYTIYHFHVDFAAPLLSTWTTFATPAAAGFTTLCPSTQACVPQLEGTGSDSLDAIGDRLMHRAAYRNFGSHESLVSNYTVSAGGVAAIRWFELRNVTAGPVTVFQESTYQPDTTWRWMGSAAMDGQGNLAIGFSASSASIHPQIRYAGRLAGDPLNTLAQGEKTLYAGTGSQTGTSNRWGDYSALTIDPVDDTTFWYTSEYYDTTGTFNWRTRIGSFNLLPHNNITNGGSTIVSAGPNGVLDPGETVTVALGVQNTGSGGLCTTAALAGALQATGGVTNPTPASQNYGAICSDDPVVFVNFTFTVNPALACGDTVTASLVMTDGATNYGTLTYTFNAGTPVATFAENFDGVVAPALPAGWVAANATGAAPLWVTSNNTPDMPPNNAFIDDPSTVSDKHLDSPSIAITSASAKLSFRNFYALESGTSYYDGGVLEVSSPNINAGAFTDITNAAVGGSFVSGGYVGTISGDFENPLAGRMAWSGNSFGYITTVANLGPNVAGQTIKLRFRMGSDNSVAATGWRIDTVSIEEFGCAPIPLSAVSRKTHGGAGTFDVDLPLVSLPGNVGIESRSGGATNDYQLVITFGAPVTVTGSPQAQVTSGAGQVGAGGTDNGGVVSVSGSVVTVPLTTVGNEQRLDVTLFGVNDGTNTGDVSVKMGVLLGDINANGLVNATDTSLVQAQSGTVLSNDNFRTDVSANGLINATDTSIVQSKSGTGLPPLP